MSNIYSTDIGECINILSKAYTKIINNHLPLTTMPSVMLWGSPGVGKSQGVRQLAHRLEEGTGKEVRVTDVRLLLFNPVDLRGIPVANADKTLALWLKPKIFQMEESEDIINILFLDELSSAPQSVQAAAYQITLDRVIGEHKLPDNCIVIAAGNRVTDKSVAIKMPKALANRLCHFNIEVDFDGWLRWAVNNGIHRYITGFLSFRRQYLDGFEISADSTAFPTPRSWEMVSKILCSVSDDVEEMYPLIAGCIGVGVLTEFKTWIKIYDKLPDVEDIFNGYCTMVPQDSSTLYALVSEMIERAKNYIRQPEKIGNSIKYAMNFPADFSMLLIRNYMFLADKYKTELMRIPEFYEWISKKGKIMND